MPQCIYFDESGFTGNNLLDPQQKYFAYGSVATDAGEAKEFVDELVRKYGIQGGELKGSRLVKFNKGRKAIDDIFRQFRGRLKVSISDKKYALACKFFEYIFEPSISEINSIFYGIGFHKFIANILYLEFVARGAGAERIFSEFERLMRTKEEQQLASIFSSSVHPENSPIIVQIREFAQYRADTIRAELASLQNHEMGKWILDLTGTALFTLLANWGLKFEELTAVCDPSKPLEEGHFKGLFDVMIGRKDKRFSDAFGQKHPITFNLSGPVQFLDSRHAHGIQIADALAAASVYALSTSDDHANRWKAEIAEIGHYGSIIPDFDFVDLRDKRVQRNAVLLLELHERAKRGASLVEGIPDYLRKITTRLIADPIL
jgi:hypothetical protein